MAAESDQPFTVTFHLRSGEAVRINVAYAEAMDGGFGHVGAVEVEGDFPTERHRAMARLTGALRLDLERDDGSWSLVDTSGTVWAFLPRSLSAISVTDPYGSGTTRGIAVGFRPPEPT
jgi:hypothetical protein